MLDAEAVVSLLKQHGLFGLFGSDGCLCCNGHLQAVSIDVSCRKSSAAKPEGFYGVLVRIYSCYMGTDPANLRMVADEVVRQLKEQTELPIMTRFCDYESDAKLKCVYCSKPKEAGQYLCGMCQVGMDPFGGRIADSHDLKRLEVVTEVE